jgi:uncharacterized protein YgbK (DUF1537 family)
MIRFGVVADDITGANDIGIMFAKAGYRTRVYQFEHPGDFARVYAPQAAPEIVILNTNSRLDARETAYRKVYDATRELQAQGCTQFHNKTCSVFRGNIGAEFDAMLDALGQYKAVVVLGFPKNGRTTVDGVHYVRGVPLEESEFRHDPIHPMRWSNLVDILQAQTRRPVAAVTHPAVRAGAAALRAAVAAAHAAADYVIVDVPDQAALAVIAAAVQDFPVLCGSSAIGEELPAVWPDAPPPVEPLAFTPQTGCGLLAVAGSLTPQTAAQVAHMRAQGTPTVELDTPRLFDADAAATIEALAATVTAHLLRGADAVLHSTQDPARVALTRERGQQAGLNAEAAARRVTAALAAITGRVLARTGQNRLLIAGGETSDAVCRHLGIHSLQIHREIQPGLPSCFSLTEPRRLLVLKSGSFGSADFFARAFDHLNEAIP